jgi:hypothetical protein
VTLDEFSATHDPPDVLKIDVEGGEEEVLRGADEILRHIKPHVICEVHLEAGAAEGRLERVTAFLTDRGYDVEHLTPGLDPIHILARCPDSRRKAMR